MKFTDELSYIFNSKSDKLLAVMCDFEYAEKVQGTNEAVFDECYKDCIDEHREALEKFGYTIQNIADGCRKIISNRGNLT